MTPATAYQGYVDRLRGWAASSAPIMHTFRQQLLLEFPHSQDCTAGYTPGRA